MSLPYSTYAPSALMIVAGIVMLVIAATLSRPSRSDLVSVEGRLGSYLITSIGRSGGRLVLSIEGAPSTFWSDLGDTADASIRLKRKPALSLLVDRADSDRIADGASIHAYTVVSDGDTLASYHRAAGNDGTRIGVAIAVTLLTILGWRLTRRAAKKG
jgi:hypothetical protein